MEDRQAELRDLLSDSEALLNKYKEDERPGSAPPPSAVATVSDKCYTNMDILAPEKLANDCTALELKVFLLKFKECLKVCLIIDTHSPK